MICKEIPTYTCLEIKTIQNQKMKSTMKCKYVAFLTVSITCLLSNLAYSQDSTFMGYKNVVRYDLSGGMLVGIDKYIVFGYERVLNSRSSISFNVGRAGLPKIVRTVVSTDSFSFNNDVKN